MQLIYLFQFILFSSAIYLYTVFTHCLHYGDIISLNFRDKLLPEYDYIIVGAGTAGSLIAHRLATETNHTFLVLEAGGTGMPLLQIPAVVPLLHGSLYDWRYQTVPQEYACHAMWNNKCRVTQGKIIGGSSKLNNMIHVRGNLSHYVKWFHGLYTEEYILKQFEFVEDNILYLDKIQYESNMASAVIEAAKELGFKELNVDFGIGFQKITVSQRHGKRWSTSDNLNYKHILHNTLVEKILITDNIAHGVNVLVVDKRKQILARNGVIVCAGAYNSPKILQLSGIGPRNVLEPLEIPVIKDLPVGKNLQEHVGSGLDLVMFNKSLSMHSNDILNPINMYNYFLHGKGPLTSPGCEVIGFVSTKNVSVPDVQYMVLPMGISSDRGSLLRKNIGIRDDVWYNYFVKGFDKYTATILPIILHPKSKGEVFITSTDPMDAPLIDPKFLSSEEDRATLIRGIELVQKFINTKAMEDLEAYLNPHPFPGCEILEIFSNRYWDCYIRKLALTSYHPVGTCSMGLPASSESVVDTSFKVIGVNNLFVADSSVLPTMPSCNINAAVAMMANIFFDQQMKASDTLVCHKSSYYLENLFKITGLAGK